MSITEKFLALDVPEQIGLLLALAVILVPLCVWGVRAFIAYCERQPIYDPIVHGPADQAQTSAEHVDKRVPASQRASSTIIGGLLQMDEATAARLVYPAKARHTVHRIREAQKRADADVQQQMLADHLRGTKL